jgi:hypothetical protein
MADPAVPTASAAVLGITASVHDKHYDRGGRALAAGAYHANFAQERRQSETLARRLFATRGDERQRLEIGADREEGEP